MYSLDLEERNSQKNKESFISKDTIDREADGEKCITAEKTEASSNEKTENDDSVNF